LGVSRSVYYLVFRLICFTTLHCTIRLVYHFFLPLQCASLTLRSSKICDIPSTSTRHLAWHLEAKKIFAGHLEEIDPSIIVVDYNGILDELSDHSSLALCSRRPSDDPLHGAPKPITSKIWLGCDVTACKLVRYSTALQEELPPQLSRLSNIDSAWPKKNPGINNQ